MKSVKILLVLCLSAQLLVAQNWPANSDYIYFGAIELGQADATKYALLQSKTSGTTFLNSPQSVFFRIANSDKMIISNSGKIGIGTTTPTANLQLGQSTMNGLLNLGGNAFAGSLKSSGFFLPE